MVLIGIDDEAWNTYKKSWALFGVRTHKELTRMLELYLQESSQECIEYAKRHLISNEPEALVSRGIGLREEKQKKSAQKKRQNSNNSY